jgi:hypothetical protein
VVIDPFFRNIAEIEKTTKEIELTYDFLKISEEMLDSALAVADGGPLYMNLPLQVHSLLAFAQQIINIEIQKKWRKLVYRLT